MRHIEPTVSVRACVIVPVKPDIMLIPATEPTKAALMFELVSEIAGSNWAISVDVGQVFVVQLVHELHRPSPASLSHVYVTALSSKTRQPAIEAKRNTRKIDHKIGRLR